MNTADVSGVAAVDDLSILSDEIASMRLLDTPPSTAYSKVTAAMHRLCAAIDVAEQNGVDPADIVAAVRSTNECMRRSPLMRRIQDWPRGYAGDFETVEDLIRGVNSSVPGTVEYYYEQSVLGSPAVSQHRNKVHAQSVFLLSEAFRNPEQVRLLSLGCGACPDLRDIQSVLADRIAECVLVDIDAEALQRSAAVLPMLREKCRFVHGDALRAAKTEEGRFQVIVSCGLFDYLPDRVATLLLRILRERRLAPGGMIFFTNIGPVNPYRTWMRYFLNWRLLDRSEEELLLLCTQAGFPANDVHIRAEETGLTLLVSIAG